MNSSITATNESLVVTLPRDVLISVFTFLWASELSAGVKVTCKDLCLAALSDERLQTRPECFIGSGELSALVWKEQKILVGAEATKIRNVVIPVVRDFVSIPQKGESCLIETVEFRYRDRGDNQSLRVDVPERFREGQIRGGKWSLHGQRAYLIIMNDDSIYALIYNGVKPGRRSLLPTLQLRISETRDKEISHHLGLSALSGDGFTMAVIVKEDVPSGGEEAGWRWTISMLKGQTLEHRGSIYAGATSCVNLSMTLSADGMVLLLGLNGHKRSRLYSTISGDLLLETTTNLDMYRTSVEKPEFSSLAFEMDNRLVEIRPHYGDTAYDSYDENELERKLSMLSPVNNFPSCFRPICIHRDPPLWLIWMKQLGNIWANLSGANVPSLFAVAPRGDTN